MSAMIQQQHLDAARLNRMVDFRSDTVTQPEQGMRLVMAQAEVGDDVYGDDPTVNLLEQRFAETVGKQAAVLFPTGTQSNLAAILSHCGRGDELLAGASYHTLVYEAGGASVLGGVSCCALPVQDDSCVSPDDVTAAVKPDDPHFPRSRLLCLENTVSGTAIGLERLKEVSDRARQHGLAVHLDGARLFNAAAELGVDVSELASIADTVSVCLSKGLGAPAGTMLACNSELEPLVRRNRKILGGSMRQSGIIAAAGLYSLDNNVDRLVEDHRRARSLASKLDNLVEHKDVRVAQNTNMVFLTPDPGDHAALCDHLEENGFLVTRKAPAMRFVLHLHHTDSDIERFAAAIRSFYGLLH
ncbi:MAG: low-specificity L-threonine aldolase [Rhodobacteraceae bacterium]|nr:low-specificity L-threonine aldolase [Paracoccaceae bacterium]